MQPLGCQRYKRRVGNDSPFSLQVITLFIIEWVNKKQALKHLHTSYVHVCIPIQNLKKGSVEGGFSVFAFPK